MTSPAADLRAESRSRALIESLGEGVCVIRLMFDAAGRPIDYRFLEANESFQRQCGLPDPTGKTIRELVPDFEPQWIEEYAQVAATGQPKQFDAEVPSIGGFYEIEAFVPQGYGPHEVAVVFRNVTARHQAESRLQADAQHKDEFLAMLAHELRNPLAPIRISADVIARIGLADPRQKAACAVIERQARHMARLLDDLLDISRVTQRKITLVRERIDVKELIGRAVEASRPLIEAHRHRLTTVLPAGRLRVEGDPTRLVQILGNLLNNAAKYTSDGGSIAIEALHEGDEAVIRVRDDGSGIAPELLPHVFELFRQGTQSLARGEGGLGIGLTLVRQLAELHGGRVEARSEGLGQGSEFTVRLPALVNAIEVAGAGALDADGKSASLRILIVEDNHDAASALATLLELDGHEVDIARDGPAGLAAAQSLVPQVVLCDIGLPGMSGYEVAQHIRALPSLQATTLVALSGYGREGDRRSAAEAGFAWHLTKPVEPKVLADLLAGLAAP